MVSTTRSGRSSALEIVLIAVLLALVINLASTLAADAVESIVLLVSTAALLLAVIAYVLARLLWPRTKKISIVGTFTTTNGPEYDPVDVHRHRFTNDVCRALQAAFGGDPALLGQWRQDGVGGVLASDPGTGRSQWRPTAGAELLNEAAEYVLLDMLSMHLEGYFLTDRFDTERLQFFGRAAVPTFVQTNRIGDIISREEDRFNHPHFNLVLPRGSTVERQDDGALKFSARGIDVLIRVDCDGFRSVLDADFVEYYLKRSYVETDNRRVRIHLAARTAIGFPMFSKRFQYVGWVESFFAQCEREVPLVNYLKEINWPSLAALLHAQEEASHDPRRARAVIGLPPEQEPSR
jgi:hypothetical protein